MPIQQEMQKAGDIISRLLMPGYAVYLYDQIGFGTRLG
jgi:alpha-beta hydrolase superfamily lysophospholipase